MKIRNCINNFIIRIEGGESVSKHARKTAKKNDVIVGKYTYGGCFRDEFNNGGKVTIGRYCSFASNVRYFGGNHPMNYGSMSPYFYSGDFKLNVKDIERHELIIGNDCWIGYNVIILPSCKRIGNGAVIGAGAIVTQNVEPYTIVAGVPARKIRDRFNESEKKLLELSEWWQLSPEELYSFYDDISEPEKWANKIIDYKSKKFKR